jgi:hypothetical protein
MNYDTAVRLLRDVHYKRDWELTPSRVWGTNGMDISIDCWVDNSNPTAPNPKTLAGAPFSIDLDKINEYDHQRFYRIVLNNLIAWEIHEAREFFRVGPRRIAPFHPHRADGDALWRETDGRQPAERFAAA